MNTDERLCSIALTLCPGIGHIGAKRMVDTVGSAADVFRLRTELPERYPGILHTSVVAALDNPAAFLQAEKELEWAE